MALVTGDWFTGVRGHELGRSGYPDTTTALRRDSEACRLENRALVTLAPVSMTLPDSGLQAYGPTGD